MTDEKKILAEIKKTRERVNHFNQWKNEPSCKKKLGQWRRKLKKALTDAETAGIGIPVDPFAPPPPPPTPPTEAELEAAAMEALLKRRRYDFQVQRNFSGWAPWGESGWSAVVVTKAAHKWCQVHRVNIKTGKIVSTGKVLRERLLYRDPALHGKDKPHISPTDVWKEITVSSPEAEPEPTEEPEAAPETPSAPSTGPRVDILPLIEDQSTDDDWE